MASMRSCLVEDFLGVMRVRVGAGEVRVIGGAMAMAMLLSVEGAAGVVGSARVVGGSAGMDDSRAPVEWSMW